MPEMSTGADGQALGEKRKLPATAALGPSDGGKRRKGEASQGTAENPANAPVVKKKKKTGKKTKNKMMQWRSINQQCRMRLDCKGAIECFDYHVKKGLIPDSQILATILSNVQAQAEPEKFFADAVRIFHAVVAMSTIEEPAYVTMIQLLAKVGGENEEDGTACCHPLCHPLLLLFASSTSTTEHRVSALFFYFFALLLRRV